MATRYAAGWISHPDGEPLSDVNEAAKAYIRREYGTEYVATDTVVIRTIAPTDVNRVPEDLPADGAALYGLIWRSFIEAHMLPAQERIMAARISGSSKEKPYPLELRATAKLLYFDGWHHVVPTSAKDEVLPFLPEGTPLQPVAITFEAMPNEPHARFTEGTLVRGLATIGISATSAALTVEQLQSAGYVRADSDLLMLTESGRVSGGLSRCVVCRSHRIPIRCRTRRRP